MSSTIPSLLIILSVLPLSLLSRDFNWNSGLDLARRLTLPMGLLTTLLMLLRLLGMMGDPSSLYSMLAESLLPSVFALMLYTILSQIFANQALSTKQWQTRLAGLMLIGIIFLHCGLQGSLLYLFDFKTMLTIAAGSYGFKQLERHSSTMHKQNVGHIVLGVAFLNAGYRSTLLILYWEDPTTIGPNIASIIFGLVYGFLIWMISEIHHASDVGGSSEPPISSSAIIGTFLLGYAPIVFFSISMDLWTMNQQTQNLHTQSDRQDQLLRDLVTHRDDNQTGHITISSDKPAWIFINDHLVSSSPLFKHDLEPGHHTIKIASCPTHGFMNPEENISWNTYWDQASDGSCREPTEAERTALIEQGLAEEVVLETTDGYDLVEMHYTSGVNFCCHNSPTKTIEIQMTDTAQIYAWSFVNNEWIQNSSVQN